MDIYCYIMVVVNIADVFKCIDILRLWHDDVPLVNDRTTSDPVNDPIPLPA